MRQITLVCLVVLFVTGCAQQPAQPAVEVTPQEAATATVPPSPTPVNDETFAGAPTENVVEPEPVETALPESTKEPASAVIVESESTLASGESSAENAEPVTACNAFLDNTIIRCESGTAFIDSNGLPTTHDMMIGIVSWQQQVALPQPYTGNNA